MFKPVNLDPSADELRKFGWVMLIGLAVIGSVFWLAGWAAQRPTVPLLGITFARFAVGLWAVGAILWIVSRISVGATRGIYIGWMSATRPVGIFMAVVMMTLMFFVFLPVFSLIVRRSDPLRRTLSNADSYWEEVKPYEPTLKRMSRLF